MADTLNVNFVSAPPLELGNDTAICQGSVLNLDATTIGATYLWSDNTTNAGLSVTIAGSYWVEMEVNGCTSRDTINVIMDPLPTVVLANDTMLCPGQIMTLDATGSGVSYLWQDNSTGPTFNVTQQGTYWVEVTNNCGTTPDSITVNYDLLPTVELGDDTALCPGDVLVLVATTPNSTYLWQDNSTNQNLNVTQQGTYWVEISDNCGSATDTLSVTMESVPTLNLGNDSTLCQGQSLMLNIVGSNVSYLWSDGSMNSSFNVTQQGTYWAEVTNNCGVASDTIDINFNPLPIFELGNDTILCPGDILVLDVTAPNSTYLWHDNSTNPTWSVTQQGTYWITATNMCGVASDTLNVDYDSIPVVELGNDTLVCAGDSFLVDATASNKSYLWHNNADNINDQFLPVPHCTFALYNFLIYDRWGDLIFETDDYLVPWDGKANDGNDIAQQDVFVWMILALDDQGKRHQYVGHVTLVR
ncbi:MAG: gliding motility-associated C-terminal domain-containing protein [Flavobacteriales bacterium]|nr:gliding motility-associated C-terminal domain-containing protein [Flavobacteriales bacterium]